MPKLFKDICNIKFWIFFLYFLFISVVAKMHGTMWVGVKVSNDISSEFKVNNRCTPKN